MDGILQVHVHELSENSSCVSQSRLTGLGGMYFCLGAHRRLHCKEMPDPGDSFWVVAKNQDQAAAQGLSSVTAFFLHQVGQGSPSPPYQPISNQSKPSTTLTQHLSATSP